MYRYLHLLIEYLLRLEEVIRKKKPNTPGSGSSRLAHVIHPGVNCRQNIISDHNRITIKRYSVGRYNCNGTSFFFKYYYMNLRINSKKTICIFPVPNSIIIRQYKASNITLKLLPFGYLLCYKCIILLNASTINMSICNHHLP